MSLSKLIKRMLRPYVSRRRGERGESIVSSKLNPLLFGKVYHKEIDNYIIFDEKGNSHQIDHIEIRSNGIFCIETKNISGKIYGNVAQDYWTQCLGRKKYRLRNPIKQNCTHVNCLYKSLNKNYRIYSIVVMVQNNANNLQINNVINVSYLRTYLKRFYDGVTYTNEAIDYIYNELLSNRAYISNESHIQGIRRNIDLINSGICPWCGGNIVEKTGRYGRFYACNNYPKCKYKVK